MDPKNFNNEDEAFTLALERLSHGREFHHIFWNREEILTKLVNKRNSENRTLLHYAVYYNNENAAKTLLDMGADVNATDYLKNKPINFVKSVKVAKLLIDHGADINARNSDGETALNYAYTCGKGDLPRFLRANGGHKGCVRRY